MTIKGESIGFKKASKSHGKQGSMETKIS